MRERSRGVLTHMEACRIRSNLYVYDGGCQLAVRIAAGPLAGPAARPLARRRSPGLARPCLAARLAAPLAAACLGVRSAARPAPLARRRSPGAARPARSPAPSMPSMPCPVLAARRRVQ